MIRPRIIITPLIVGLTAVTTGLQIFLPWLPRSFGRVPGTLARGEYWRLITPIFFHDSGWRQIVFNLSAIAITGVITERIFTSRRWQWLVMYFGAGLTGEIAGYAWQPLGAGASVAGCGLLGTIAAWLLLRPTIQAKMGGSLVLGGAMLLIVIRDIHGPPLLFGVVVGGAFLLAYRQNQIVPKRAQ